MTPVYQRHPRGWHLNPWISGDCTRASLATILDLALDDVPHLVGHELAAGGIGIDLAGEWHRLARRWLRHTHSLDLVTLAIDDADALDVHYLAGVPSRRPGASDRARHHVVARAGAIVHDPNPNNAHRPPYTRDEIDPHVDAVAFPYDPDPDTATFAARAGIDLVAGKPVHIVAL